MRLREPAADAFGEGGEALIGRRALPAQRERDLAVVVDVEGREMGADRLRQARRDRSSSAQAKSGCSTCRLRRGSSAPGFEM